MAKTEKCYFSYFYTRVLKLLLLLLYFFIHSFSDFTLLYTKLDVCLSINIEEEIHFLNYFNCLVKKKYL